MNRNQISPITLHSDVKGLSQIQLLPGQIYQGEGFIPFALMPRVLEELDLDLSDGQKLGVHWIASTWMDEPVGAPAQYRLRIGLKGELPLQCQKCFGKLEEVLDFEAQFLILENEDAVDAYPLDDDLEDVLAQDPKFNLFELLEGEVLLSIPLMPEHPPGKCQKLAKTSTKSKQNSPISSKSQDFEDLSKKPNPFEILKKLKLDK